MSFERPKAAGAPERGSRDGSGAIVEMVREGILKAREKLIDLSLRNGMLNYRHSESSSRHVRVVHQLPSAVVDCLASEKSIDLVPLPPLESIPRDEETDVFRAALRDAIGGRAASLSIANDLEADGDAVKGLAGCRSTQGVMPLFENQDCYLRQEARSVTEV